jgi:outer membrane protein
LDIEEEYLKLSLRLVIASLFLFNNYLAFACEPPQECLLPNSWQIGVAVGLGVRSNPLVDGDNVPLLLLPDIAWYGDAAYFDNGEFGYQWVETKTHAFETFIHLDEERSFFTFWSPTNIFLPSSGLDILSPGSEPVLQPPAEISINDIASRKWAINGGLRWHYKQKSGEWQISLEKDISGVHKGEKLQLSYQHNWQWQDWRIALKSTAIWKSEKLSDYYYGISARDNVSSQFYYHAEAGWQPKLSLQVQHPISSSWLWLLSASYQKLHSGITNSPLVREKDVQSVFSGVAYRF